MKTNKIFLALAVAAAAFTACDDDDAKRELSPEFTGSNEVYFPVSAESHEFDPSDGIETYTVTIARRDSIGEVTVPIEVLSNDDNIFQVPANVTFADKACTADFDIAFPGGKEGVNYTLKVTVPSADINPYLDKVSTYSFSFVNLAWQNAEAPAVWEDGIIMGAFGVDYIPFYVDYQYVILSDGSAKYRFLNPFAGMATDVDQYGVYNGYPYNDPGDWDEEGTYNLIVDVDRHGVASMEEGLLGVDWGYGPFGTGSIYGNISSNINSYPLGTLVGSTIMFPDNSLYIELPTNGIYPAMATTIYLDSKKYQEEHSVLHISDLDGAFNNEEIIWSENTEANFTEFNSKAFGFADAKALLAAEDMDPNAGDQSEFLNLYAVADAYTEGYKLAFYWNKDKNTLSIPTQPIGVQFAGKQIYVRDAGGSVVEDGVEFYTIPCQKFTFNVELVTKDGNLIGNYTESYYWSTESKPAPEVTKDFFLGTFTMTGPSQFNGEAPADFEIEIYEEEDGSFIIEGATYSPIVAVYNDENKTLSIAPQQLADYGPYDMTLYTTTLDGEIGETEDDAIIMSVSDPFAGIISLDESTTCDGFLVNSDAAGGWVDGFYDIEFTRSAAAATARKAAFGARPFQATKRAVKTGKINTAGLKIQGKATRYSFKQMSTRLSF